MANDVRYNLVTTDEDGMLEDVKCRGKSIPRIGESVIDSENGTEYRVTDVAYSFSGFDKGEEEQEIENPAVWVKKTGQMKLEDNLDNS